MNRIFTFNQNALWSKIADFSRSAGRIAARPVLLLWFVMTDKHTPKADKLLVLSAISYLVLPVDILNAKRLPVIGWLDEIVSVSVAYQKVCQHITPEMQARADALLDRWFPEYTPYEMIEG